MDSKIWDSAQSRLIEFSPEQKETHQPKGKNSGSAQDLQGKAGIKNNSINSQPDNSVSNQSESKNNLTATKAETQPSPTENKQLTQILQTIQSLEIRIAELEKSGNNPQQVQVLKQEVKALETQKQAQLAKSDTSIKNKPTNKQIINNSAKPSLVIFLLIVGGLLVISAALAIGYLLRKDKNKK